MTRGFTLLELLVVIAIVAFIAIFVGVAFPKFHQKYSEAEYQITHDGEIYYVQSYSKENQGSCLYLAEYETRVCGDFTIEKLHREE